MNVDAASRQVDTLIARAASEFTNKRVKEIKTYPELASFPYPIQRLLVGEIRGMETRVVQGRRAYEFCRNEEIYCRCVFFQNYTLPCRHIFHSDYVSRISIPGIRRDAYLLNEQQWERFSALFQNRGLEVYGAGDEGIKQVRVELSNREARIRRQQLAIREMLEQIRGTMFGLGERLASFGAGDDDLGGRAEAVFDLWRKRILEVNQPFIHLTDEVVRSSLEGLTISQDQNPDESMPTGTDLQGGDDWGDAGTLDPIASDDNGLGGDGHGDGGARSEEEGRAGSGDEIRWLGGSGEYNGGELSDEDWDFAELNE